MGRQSRHGYGAVSLALTGLLVVLALLPISEHLKALETAVGVVSLAAAILLADRGIRFGHGLGKVAARLSLGMLLLWVLATCIAGILVGIRLAAESGSR